MLLAACADSDLAPKDTLSGDGVKTPLAVTALLDASAPSVKSRAADKTFADGDRMVAYLRHVTWNGGFTTAESDKRTPVTADQAPRLVTFTATGPTTWDNSIDDIYPFDADNNIAINSENTQQATGLTASYTSTSGANAAALYWDDFSSSASEATDLRTAQHYLQSYYGYCFNGGEGTDNAQGTKVQGCITTVLDKEHGTLGWTILTDQSAAAAMQHSDLLWSAEQKPVSYAHSDKVDGNRPGLVIPFTHAMSKVTINVTAGTGFASDYDFDGTAITLNDVRTTCTAKAPTAKLTFPNPEVIADVKMLPGDGTGTRAFSAIIVPSVLTVGNTLATITGMDGNTYTIPVTEAIVKTDRGWGSQLTAAKEDVNHGTAQSRPRRTNDASIPAGSGHQMKSGVHYVLNVTLNETAINVSAVIVDWDVIEAEGEGEIHFANDIKVKGSIDNALKDNGFDIYKSASTTFGTKATTMRWNKAASTWKYYPTIYWQGGTTYFRALSGARADAEGTPEVNESLTMDSGRDVLWGTTEAHSGTDADNASYDYKEGDPLKPRTGDVPLVFYHPMSKITVNLKNLHTDAEVPAGVNKADYADPRNPLLDLAGARIQISDLKLTGTIELDKGAITPTGTAANLFFSERYAANDDNAATPQVEDYVVIPQTIPDASIVTITLADGSIYKVQLNKCNVQGSSTAITAWQRGKHYVYDIYLSKEAITFRALVKDWEEASGSGNATLEWD